MASRTLIPFSEQSKYCHQQRDHKNKSRRVKQIASIIVLLLIILTGVILSVPNITTSTKLSYIASIPKRYIDTENILPEEREVLSDVRTSFVPTGSIALPPSDRQNIFGSKDDLWHNSAIEKRLNINELPRYESTFSVKRKFAYVSHRQRRNLSTANHTSLLVLNTNNRQPNKTKSEEQNSAPGSNENISDYTDDSHSEQDLELENNSNETIHNGFQSFWKAEGDAESIRKIQSETMQSYMDMSANPCEDFYQYACGNWQNRNPIPGDKSGFDTFEMLRENLDLVLKDLLEVNMCIRKNNEKGLDIENNFLRPEATSSNDKSDDCGMKLHESEENKSSSRNEKKLKLNQDLNEAELKTTYLYESCMNQDIIEKRGTKPLLDLLKTLGGWPVIDEEWNQTNFDWLELMAKLRLYNNDILVSEWVGPDIKKSDEYVIQFDQTTLGLPVRDYFLQSNNSVYLDAYKNYMIKIITLMGATPENAATAAEELIWFETRLAKITSPPDRRNVTELYQRLELKELIELVPKIDWEKYLNIVLRRNVTINETVVIFALKYLQDLVVLVEDTDSKVVSNYLLWRFVRHRVNNLDDRFQDEKQKFYFILFGRETSPPRWKNCVTHVNSNMGMALGSMFVKKYFQENSKNDTFKMTMDIQNSFRELLNINSWIDDETKGLAKDKVDSMMLKIGYPSYILNEEEINAKYKDLVLHPDKYFENTLNILQHLAKIEQSKVGETVNKTIWNTAPAIVNAYYSRNKNQIMLPAGILQPPFYHRYFPRSLNFGGIGVVIGHEITHGFDDKGRLFDKQGNLNRWWKDAAFEMFYKKAQCLIDQYGLYTISEVSMSIDGVSTQGENIADNGGIKQAFRAYKHWLSKNDAENETLPGLNATNTQLFFLNFAQVWCGSMRPEAIKNKLKTAVHSPGKFRVIGTLSNSEEFAKEYNCPPGSPMNPIDKCTVW